MIKNVRIGKMRLVETGKMFGNMNTNKAFYPESFTKEDIKEDFLERRIKAGEYFGFDGCQMFMADQKNKDGSFFEITREYVEDNPLGWTDIPEDILVVNSDLPGVVIGHPAADCPVIMAYDKSKEVLAIGHCSADLIDMKMPSLVIESLQRAYDSRVDDIVVYGSACAGTDYSYDEYPKWAKDAKVWDGCINLEEDGLYHIDLRRALSKQLVEKQVGGFYLSPIDTIHDERFYSNSAAFHGDLSKKGRNFSGAFIEGKILRRVKTI